jgi:hypothetical protein
VDAGAFDFAKFAGRVLGEFVGDFDADGFGLITGFDQFFAEPDDGSAGHASDIDDAAWFGGHELDDEVTDFLAFEEAAAELLGGFGNGGLDGCLGVSIGGDFLGGFFPGEVGFEFFVGWRVLQEDEAAVPAFHDLPRVDGIGLQGVKVLLVVADVAGAIGVWVRGDIGRGRGRRVAGRLVPGWAWRLAEELFDNHGAAFAVLSGSGIGPGFAVHGGWRGDPIDDDLALGVEDAHEAAFEFVFIPGAAAVVIDGIDLDGGGGDLHGAVVIEFGFEFAFALDHSEG